MAARGPRSESVAAQVLRTFQALSRDGGPVRVADAAVALDMVSDKDKRPLYRAISDLKRSGKLAHTGPGAYRPTEKATPVEIAQERMWRAVRLYRKQGKAIAPADLVRLASVSNTYAREFLRLLESRRIVERTTAYQKNGGRADTFRMIVDPVEMPEMAENAERLREMRAQRRDEALAALTAAELAIQMARRAVESDGCGGQG